MSVGIVSSEGQTVGDLWMRFFTSNPDMVRIKEQLQSANVYENRIGDGLSKSKEGLSVDVHI